MLKKVLYLLSGKQKKQLVFLGIGLLIGVFFEMLGLGVLIPSLGLILKNNFLDSYPILKPIVNLFGNPTHREIVIGCMIFLVTFYFVKSIFLLIISWMQSKFTADLTFDISEKLFFGYLNQPYSFHLKKNSAELLRNIQNEVGQFSWITQSVIALIVELSIVIGVTSTLIIIEPLGAIVVILFLMTFVLLFQQVTKKRLSNWGEVRQEQVGYINQHILQGIGGIKEVKFLGKEGYFFKKFRFHNIINTKIQTRVTFFGLVPRLYLEFLAVSGLASLIIVMIFQKKPIEALLPILGVFAAAAFRLLPSANRIMSSMQLIRYAKPVVELLYKEFNLINNEKSNDYNNEIVEVTLSRMIRLENVKFKYENALKYALNNISIEIKKGEIIGLIGSSGSGKSTIVDLILGLLVPTEGKITVDDVDIRKGIRSWRSNVGYVPQTIYLTDDTIINNIAFGIDEKNIDLDQVIRVLKAASLDEFINSLPLGLYTMVGERGVRLSGGQKQRIGIARALYNNPSILLLDEATSALDSTTENEIMSTVFNLKKDKTILIVAHRLTTVKYCNLIYKLESGFIVDSGVPGKIIDFNLI
uniref:ABC transporter ATP-binding protein n=1 Tax=Algoriphagus sp. TaxID=1872435 RepID=UPI004048B01A